MLFFIHSVERRIDGAHSIFKKLKGVEARIRCIFHLEDAAKTFLEALAGRRRFLGKVRVPVDD